MKLLLAVAAGGALGALGRHAVVLVMARWLGTGFPWGTLVVNVAGSFLFGLLAEAIALRWQVGAEMRAFLLVGGLGAFTTFSTFSMDVALLSERGALGLAAVYVLASVVASIAALFAGLALMRGLLA